MVDDRCWAGTFEWSKLHNGQAPNVAESLWLENCKLGRSLLLDKNIWMNRIPWLGKTCVGHKPHGGQMPPFKLKLYVVKSTTMDRIPCLDKASYCAMPNLGKSFLLTKAPWWAESSGWAKHYRQRLHGAKVPCQTKPPPNLCRYLLVK